MYSTTAYIYQQRTRVLMMDTGAGETFTYRYDPVYAKTLTINKGVDNVLLFEFINQEEKPVNITGSTFVFRAISQNGGKLLIEKPLVALSATLGRAKVTLNSEDLWNIQAQPAQYSISRTQPGGLTEAVFVDAQAGARAAVNIQDSVLPQFIPSSPCIIPTLEVSNEIQADGLGYADWGNPYYGNPTGTGGNYYNTGFNTEYFSSYIEPRGPVTTIQMTLDQYTGTIKIQGAENYQSRWYNVSESRTYFNETKTIYWNIVGWHPLLKIGFNNSIFATYDPPGVPASAYAICTDGVLTSVQIQNGGSGYLAPPKVSIVGNGSGAVCEAEINDTGVVTAINVINGGSGYWPVPAGGVNTAAYPVPPQNQGALVVISTGAVIDIFYR